MAIERHHNPIPAEEADGAQIPKEQAFLLEPAKVSSLAEAVEQGRAAFLEILFNANIRSLVRYIDEGGINLARLAEIPLGWKARFKTKRFLGQTYTWHNPKLCLLSKRAAAKLALDELLKRLKSSPERSAKENRNSGEIPGAG
jgi:hypothetical protein